MALIRMKCFSEELGMQAPVTVILPHRTPEQANSGALHKVLWLLHGATGDHTDWTRFTSIERYVEGTGLCVVMPSARMSRYRDMAHGGKFFTHIADELPQILGRMLPLSAAREDNYVCGLSMGGAGALRLALLRPGRYAMAGCLSAALSNYQERRLSEPGVQLSYKLVFGTEDPAGEMRAMQDVARKLAEAGGTLPRIYHCCGTEDFLLDNARETRDFFQSLPGNPFGYVYEEDSGAHTWEYWDEHIRHFLKLIV